MLSFGQLKKYCAWILPQLEGAQLQNIWTDGEYLALEFYLQGPSFLCFGLGTLPQMVWLRTRPVISKTPKPVTLFLNSHGKNLRLQELFVEEDKGRVVRLQLGSSQKSCLCRAQLVPKNTNFFVQSEGKTISWNKPKELPPSPSHDEGKEVDLDWEAYAEQWLQERKPQPKTQAQNGSAEAGAVSAPTNDQEKTFLRSIEKKKKAIEAIQSQQQDDVSSRYLQLGEILKYIQKDVRTEIVKNLPAEVLKLYDTRLSLKQNRERCFQKVKDLRRKQEGTLSRLDSLQKEVEKLTQSWQAGTWQKNLPNKSSQANFILQKAESKARKLVLSDGLEAVIGKSAKDNLAILRQARAWDFWFHLRDFPGAYAILFRNKNQVVNDAAIAQISQWIVDESVGKKQISSGGKYAVLVAECRYVKPVKGATGLVTFQNERVFHFASK